MTDTTAAVPGSLDRPVPFTLTPKAEAALAGPVEAVPAPCAPLPLVDNAAIRARAEAAPGDYWIAFSDSVWIPWTAEADTPPSSPWDHGRYIHIQDGDWHDADEPHVALWQFVASARDDVLALSSEVDRLHSLLNARGRRRPRPGHPVAARRIPDRMARRREPANRARDRMPRDEARRGNRRGHQRLPRVDRPEPPQGYLRHPRRPHRRTVRRDRNRARRARYRYRPHRIRG